MATFTTYEGDKVWSCDIGDYTISGLEPKEAYEVEVYDVRRGTLYGLFHIVMTLLANADGEICLYNLGEMVEHYLLSSGHFSTPVVVSCDGSTGSFTTYYSRVRPSVDVSTMVARNMAVPRNSYSVAREAKFVFSEYTLNPLKVFANYLDLNLGEVHSDEFSFTPASATDIDLSPYVVDQLLSDNDINGSVLSYSIYCDGYSIDIYVWQEKPNMSFAYRNQLNSWQLIHLTGETSKALSIESSEGVCKNLIELYDNTWNYEVTFDFFVPHFMCRQTADLLMTHDLRWYDGESAPGDCPKLILTGHTFDDSDGGTDPTTCQLKFKFADRRLSPTAQKWLDGVFNATYHNTYS